MSPPPKFRTVLSIVVPLALACQQPSEVVKPERLWSQETGG